MEDEDELAQMRLSASHQKAKDKNTGMSTSREADVHTRFNYVKSSNES
jgi:hypothetical protein